MRSQRAHLPKLRQGFIYFLVFSLCVTFPGNSNAEAPDAAAGAKHAAAKNTAGAADQAEKSEKKRQEGEEQMAQGNTGKGLEMLAQAAMLAASAAAMAAAAGGNKKREKVARSADPITPPVTVPNQPNIVKDETPEMPFPRELPTPSSIAQETPIAEVKEVPKETPKESPSVTLNVNRELARQLADTPESEIPDSVPDPRTKLGYDERNPTGGRPSGQSNFISQNSARPLDSASTSPLPSAGTPTPQKENWVKNQTEPDTQTASHESGNNSEGTAKTDDPASQGITEMLNSLMGKNGSTGLEGGVNFGGIDIVMDSYLKSKAPAQEKKENIFEHASWRYQTLVQADRIRKQRLSQRQFRDSEMAVAFRKNQ